MYARYIKRILDFLLSFTALTLLSPIRIFCPGARKTMSRCAITASRISLTLRRSITSIFAPIWG